MFNPRDPKSKSPTIDATNAPERRFLGMMEAASMGKTQSTWHIRPMTMDGPYVISFQ